MYALSSRQKKSLLVRGTPLLIALPLPATPPDDLLAHARAAITGVEPSLIVSATEEEILVQLPALAGTKSLASIFGEICDRAAPNLPEPLTVVVIVARLEPRGSRHKPDPIAWPATYQDSQGTIWPKEQKK
jgi:hypothetical protein